MKSFKKACIMGAILVVSGSVSLHAQCVDSLEPHSREHPSISETGSFLVFVSEPPCAWTAHSDSDWITIVSGSSGTGPAVVTYAVSENLLGTPRTGTVSVGGHVFTVNQAAASAGLQGKPRGSLPAGFSLDFRFTPSSASVIPISYSIPVRSRIHLAVYSVGGKKLFTLEEGEVPPGIYSANLRTNGLNSGMVFCRMAAPAGILSRVIPVLK